MLTTTERGTASIVKPAASTAGFTTSILVEELLNSTAQISHAIRRATRQNYVRPTLGVQRNSGGVIPLIRTTEQYLRAAVLNECRNELHRQQRFIPFPESLVDDTGRSERMEAIMELEKLLAVLPTQCAAVARARFPFRVLIYVGTREP